MSIFDYAPAQLSLERRLTNHTLGEESGCWNWLGCINRGGYGKLGMLLAHRAMYELRVGPIPAGMQLDHLCRNRACVNPAHLEPVSPGENTHRGYLARGIVPGQVCGKGHPGPFAVRASGPRRGEIAYCKVCRNAWRRRRYAEGRYS